MAGLKIAKVALVAILLASPSNADLTRQTIADDVMLFGSGNSVQLDAPRDVLAAGSTVVHDTRAVVAAIRAARRNGTRRR